MEMALNVLEEGKLTTKHIDNQFNLIS